MGGTGSTHKDRRNVFAIVVFVSLICLYIYKVVSVHQVLQPTSIPDKSFS